MSSELLRTGDKAQVRFRFIKNPEYLRIGMRMVFREGRTKAVGNVTKLYPHVSAVAQNTRQQRASKKDAHHSLKPQNEPQKPSKRNRRSRNRGYHGDSEAPGKENKSDGVESPSASARTWGCRAQLTHWGQNRIDLVNVYLNTWIALIVSQFLLSSYMSAYYLEENLDLCGWRKIMDGFVQQKVTILYIC